MLFSYTDESGHSKHPECRYVALAGFVGDDIQWKNFESDWKEALNAYIGGQELHMKDFGRGPLYAGWNHRKQHRFLERIVSAITNSGVEAVGCAVSLDDFEALPLHLRKATIDPYYMAFQEVTKGLAFRGAPRSEDLETQQVMMVYARQDEYGATEKGRASQLWHNIKNGKPQYVWSDWMGSYAPGSPKNVLPLQAADFFAYELTREFESWRNPNRPPMRMGLKMLLRGLKRRPLIKLYDLPGMLDMYRNSGIINKPFEQFHPITDLAYLHMAIVDKILRERASE